MKFSFGTVSQFSLRAWLAGVAGLAMNLIIPISSQAQILYLENSAGNTVETYDAATGTVLNPSLVSGLNNVHGLAVADNALYVAQGNSVGEYNATTGAVVNQSLVSGLSGPFGIAVAGGNLYVANHTGNTIGEYNATTGAVVNAALVSGLSGPSNLLLSGNNLYVTNNQAYAVGVYNATTGATINASLIPSLSPQQRFPFGLALSGSDLYVSDFKQGVFDYNATTGAYTRTVLVYTNNRVPYGLGLIGNTLYVGTGGIVGDTVGTYNATTGATMSDPLISGVNGSFFALVVPEPGTWTMVLLAGGTLAGWETRRRTRDQAQPCEH